MKYIRPFLIIQGIIGMITLLLLAIIGKTLFVIINLSVAVIISIIGLAITIEENKPAHEQRAYKKRHKQLK